MHQFDADISFDRTETHRFRGIVSDRWSVNGNPDGGYLMAIMAHAMARVSAKKATPVFTANYVSRCVPG